MITIYEEEFGKLTTYLKNSYGINLTQKKNLIEGRLSNTIAERGFTSFKEYLNFVFSEKSQDEINLLINKLTTNHTYFMREVKHFEYFSEAVLPYFEAVLKDKDLRVWSAGCSTGEEPYTLAMILQDYFGGLREPWDKKLLATDISLNVLQQAEKGIYSEEAVKDLPKVWRMSYFNKAGRDGYKVSDSLRKEVIFRDFNLMEEVFPFKKKFHTIFCRNVMIYFDSSTKEKLINKFYDMTEAGGYLFIGHSESINRDNCRYTYIMPGVYRKG